MTAEPTPDHNRHGVTRRAVLGGGLGLGAATALGSVLTTAPRAAARPRPGASASRSRVAIFGGGMAGLATAHELIERGFAVDVYEARAVLGGKARSFGVPGSARHGRAELPAEHGFRFFPGFYRNVPDSMRRIPFGRGSSVDSLRGLESLLGPRGFGGGLSLGPHKSVAGFLPVNFTKLRPVDLGRLTDPAYLLDTIVQAFSILLEVPITRMPAELLDFARCVLVYITSCDQRRRTDFDAVSWWNFLKADSRSTFYQDLVVKGTTMDLVAVKPHVASVGSAGNIIEAFLWNLLAPLPGPDDAWALRFLDAPTSDCWITPWARHLADLGVRFHMGQPLEALQSGGGKLIGARVPGGNVDADHFVCAFPIDRATTLLRTPELLRLDPRLDEIKHLQQDWMNGMQIFLRRPVETLRGILGSIDHPWTISAVAQSMLWTSSIPATYGDGTVREVLSIDISTWNQPGITTTRKRARECSAEEIFAEVWSTLTSRFGSVDHALSDRYLHSWFLDPAITWGSDGMARNDEPLTVQTVGTWDKRPRGATAVPNLFVAGDWIQTNANVCCMEGGNEAGRIAAQAVIDASGRSVEPVVRFDYYVPPQMAGLKRSDAARHRSGQRNIFDA